MRLLALILYRAVPALFAVVAGCATPQYQTTVHLIPPVDAEGRACVQACDARKIACQADCKTHYQACAKSVEPQVEARYIEALKQYELELKRYAAALRHYEMEVRFDWWHRYPYRHSYWWDPWWDPWPRYFPPAYREPVMPTRASVQAQLEAEQCQADCGCLPAFDDCFVGCGGQRVSETVCIKNCPPKQ